MEEYTILYDGALYRVPKSHPIIELAHYKLIIPRTSVPDVLSFLHSTEEQVHMGVFKTFFNARRRFWWPGMYADIKKWVGQ